MSAAWVDPATSSAHWLGEISYDPVDSVALHAILANRHIFNIFRSCSLTHYTATDVVPAEPEHMALLTVGRRRGAVVYWDGEYEVYLRKTGFLEYTRRRQLVNASMADPTSSSVPPATPASPSTAASTAIDPAKLPPQTQPGQVKRTLAELLAAEGDKLPLEFLEKLSETLDENANLRSTLESSKEQVQKMQLEVLASLKQSMAELEAQRDEATKQDWEKIVSNPVLVEASVAADKKVPVLFDVLRAVTQHIRSSGTGHKRAREDVADRMPPIPYAATDVSADRKAPASVAMLRRVQAQLRENSELKRVQRAVEEDFYRGSMSKVAPPARHAMPPPQAPPQRVEASILQDGRDRERAYLAESAQFYDTLSSANSRRSCNASDDISMRFGSCAPSVSSMSKGVRSKDFAID